MRSFSSSFQYDLRGRSLYVTSIAVLVVRCPCLSCLSVDINIFNININLIVTSTHILSYLITSHPLLPGHIYHTVRTPLQSTKKKTRKGMEVRASTGNSNPLAQTQTHGMICILIEWSWCLGLGLVSCFILPGMKVTYDDRQG